MGAKDGFQSQKLNHAIKIHNMKNSILFFLSLSLFAMPNIWLVAQTPTVKLTTECGKIVESEFTNSNETQDIQIRLNAGDMIDINIVPVGNYLKMSAHVLDPGGSVIIKEDECTMFYNQSKSLIVKSEILSASGLYTIRVFNYYPTATVPGTVGAYTAYIKCKKRNGEVIEPK